mmetsp:Transcript_24140/g.33228  ORF Transcript_24140/g.33228 Transcript_24140/m.33228 type:complete len:359 (+) Transcript_24140:1-1077(+)
MDLALKTFNNPKGKAAENGPLHNIVNILSSDPWVQKLQKVGASDIAQSQVVATQLRVCLPQWAQAVENSPALGQHTRSRVSGAFQQVESRLQLSFGSPLALPSSPPAISFGSALLKSSAAYSLPGGHRGGEEGPSRGVEDLGTIVKVSPEEEHHRRAVQRQEVALQTLRKQSEAQNKALEEDIRVATVMSLHHPDPGATGDDDLQTALEMSRLEVEQQYKQAQEFVGSSGSSGIPNEDRIDHQHFSTHMPNLDAASELGTELEQVVATSRQRQHDAESISPQLKQPLMIDKQLPTDDKYDEPSTSEEIFFDMVDDKLDDFDDADNDFRSVASQFGPVTFPGQSLSTIDLSGRKTQNGL